MANKLVEDIIRILKSALGDFVARAMVKTNCGRIGTALDELSLEQLPDLIGRVKSALPLFVDRAIAMKLIEDLERLKATG